MVGGRHVQLLRAVKRVLMVTSRYGDQSLYKGVVVSGKGIGEMLNITGDVELGSLWEVETHGSMVVSQTPCKKSIKVGGLNTYSLMDRLGKKRSLEMLTPEVFIVKVLAGELHLKNVVGRVGEMIIVDSKDISDITDVEDDTYGWKLSPTLLLGK